MKKLLMIICLEVAIIVVSGCLGLESGCREYDAYTGQCTDSPRLDDLRRQTAIDNYPEWSDIIVSRISAGKISLGMTKEQVIASWGKPDDINRSVGSWGVHEQWVYGNPYRNYLYFENGILTSWQT